MQIGNKMLIQEIKLNDYKCTNCATSYKSERPYMHDGMLGLVCLDCMEIYAPESQWA